MKFMFSGVEELCSDGAVHPAWLLYLAIALGIMFLVMLIINCFLCSAMTCSCARTEVTCHNIFIFFILYNISDD